MIEFEINTIDSPNGGWKIKHPVTAVVLDIFAIPYDNGIWPILKKMNLLKQVVH